VHSKRVQALQDELQAAKVQMESFQEEYEEQSLQERRHISDLEDEVKTLQEKLKHSTEEVVARERALVRARSVSVSPLYESLNISD
jgi:predicted RNase H-like nuclease (RuvC/YqgF family)